MCAFVVVFVFATSGTLKIISSAAADGLVNEFVGSQRVVRLTSSVVAVAELIAAAGILAAQSWAIPVAGGLIATFSVAILVVLWRGRRPRCGCLGDLSVSRVGHLHLVRNLAVLGCIGAATASPNERPIAGVLPAVALTFILLVGPEAVDMYRQFRTNVRAEVRAVFENRRVVT